MRNVRTNTPPDDSSKLKRLSTQFACACAFTIFQIPRVLSIYTHDGHGEEEKNTPGAHGQSTVFLCCVRRRRCCTQYSTHTLEMCLCDRSTRWANRYNTRKQCAHRQQGPSIRKTRRRRRANAERTQLLCRLASHAAVRPSHVCRAAAPQPNEPTPSRTNTLSNVLVRARLRVRSVLGSLLAQTHTTLTHGRAHRHHIVSRACSMTTTTTRTFKHEIFVWRRVLCTHTYDFVQFC